MDICGFFDHSANLISVVLKMEEIVYNWRCNSRGGFMLNMSSFSIFYLN